MLLGTPGAAEPEEGAEHVPPVRGRVWGVVMSVQCVGCRVYVECGAYGAESM